jgi:hypothetical protein
MKTKLEKLGKVDYLPYALRFNDITIFSDGRVLIKTDTKEEATIIFNKYVR